MFDIAGSWNSPKERTPLVDIIPPRRRIPSLPAISGRAKCVEGLEFGFVNNARIEEESSIRIAKLKRDRTTPGNMTRRQNNQNTNENDRINLEVLHIRTCSLFEDQDDKI